MSNKLKSQSIDLLSSLFPERKCKLQWKQQTCNKLIKSDTKGVFLRKNFLHSQIFAFKEKHQKKDFYIAKKVKTHVA